MKALSVLISAFSAFSSLASPAFAQASSDKPPVSADGRDSSPTTEEVPLDLSGSAEDANDAVEVKTDQQTQSGEGDMKIEESAILPSTDDFLESEAPTMDLDCERSDNCLDSLTEPAEGPVLSSPDAVDTPDVETQETERVVTEP